MTGRRVVSVGSLRFGEDPFVVVAGPGPDVPVEQLAVVAGMMSGTPHAMFRCGSTPLGRDELVAAADHAKRAKLPTVGMVDATTPFEAACEALDMVEVEVDSLRAVSWSEVVRSSIRPILLRRDAATTIDDWLAAGDSLSASGRDVVLESDFAIEGLLETALDRSSLPILVDAMSAAAGPSAVVLEARVIGAHGAVIDLAPSEGHSSRMSGLNSSGWSDLVFALEVIRTRGAIDRVDREIVRLLGERQRLSLDIGKAKADRGLPVFAPERERELMNALRELATTHDLGAGHVEAVFHLVLAESRAAQERRRATEKY